MPGETEEIQGLLNENGEQITAKTNNKQQLKFGPARVLLLILSLAVAGEVMRNSATGKRFKKEYRSNEDSFQTPQEVHAVAAPTPSPVAAKTLAPSKEDSEPTFCLVLNNPGGFGNKLSGLVGYLALARASDRRVAVSGPGALWTPFWQSDFSNQKCRDFSLLQ